MRSNPICCVAVMCIAVSSLASSAAFAQETENRNSLRDGTPALLFEVNGDFDLRSFEGATLSFKHHCADNRAMRLGATLQMRTQDTESRSPVDASNQDSDSYEAQLTLHRLYYYSTAGSSSVFLGFGPTGGWRLQKNTVKNESNQTQSESVSRGWNAGIGTVLGFEWFPRRDISLIAEYGSVVRYAASRTEARSAASGTRGPLETTAKSESDAWEFAADAVRFGVSLYW